MRSRMRPYYRGSDRTKDSDIQRRSWREGPHPRGTADRRPWFGLCAELPRRSDWRLCAELRAGPHRLLADVRPEGGARCVSSARRDLCGGRGVILVPTATVRILFMKFAFPERAMKYSATRDVSLTISRPLSSSLLRTRAALSRPAS